jgi:hypothetical protein
LWQQAGNQRLKEFVGQHNVVLFPIKRKLIPLVFDPSEMFRNIVAFGGSVSTQRS